MNIVADECVPTMLRKACETAGCNVVMSATLSSFGIPDETVLNLAYERGWLLLTCDKGFGKLVYFNRLPTAGVVLCRFDDKVEMHKTAECLRVELATRPDLLMRHFTTVAAEHVRRRRLPDLDEDEEQS